MSEEIKSIFELEEFKPLRNAFEARKLRFNKYWGYYKSLLTVVNDPFVSDVGKYIGSHIANSVKPLFTPLARAVELDVALIPGNWRLATESAQHQDAVKQVLAWSRWEVEGDIFVRYAVAMGESGLRIVQVGDKVIIQPMRPDSYVVEPMSLWDATPAKAVFISQIYDSTGQTHELAEVITPAQIRTFRDGVPYAVDADAGRIEAYANPLGFVPFVVCRLDSGDGVGEPTFDNTLTSLDQVNRQATYMSTIIRRHAEPQWAVIGAEAGDLQKDGETVWFFPEGSDLKAVLAAVDFDGLLKFIQEIKEEMKDSLPELAFSKLAGLERIAVATIEIQMIEPVTKIRRLRKPCDQALADALRVAGKSGVDGLAGLDDWTLAFDKERPVIVVDAMTRTQIEQAQNSGQLSKMALEREKLLLGATTGQGN